MFKNIYYFILLILIFPACKQKVAEPSYIKINNFIVTTTSLTQGTSYQSIPEAIIYIDDQNAGVYHLPASVPIALNGSHKITIAPAIVENAIASNPRYLYTFFTAFDTILNLTGSAVVECTPKIKYRSAVKFELIEDFENPLSLFGKFGSNTLDTLQRDSLPQDNIEKGHCALFDLPNGILMEYATRNEYSLPSSATSSTFVEINYKSELALAIGLYIDIPSMSSFTKTGIVTLNPKSTWSKAYINLTDVVSVKPIDTKFMLFISSLNTSGFNQKVFVDNIKIIHFE